MIGLHNRLVLNSDVILRSGALSATVPNEGPDDVVVTRSASRFPSLAVSRQTAEFLLAFTTASTLSTAVQLIGQRLKTPADEVLTEIYPNLRTFLDRSILVRVGKARRASNTRRVGTWAIQRPIHDFDDSSVFLVKNDKGQFGALKLMRGAGAAGIIERECRVLGIAGSDLTPIVLEACTTSPEPYLITEWKAGVVVGEAFREVRVTGSRSELLRMAIRLVEGFERLHQRGIIHGDVQPKNAVFDLQGRTWILDLSHSSAPGFETSWRMGVPFFYEPEYADKLLNDSRQSVSLDLAGENYAVAALVYHLLSGVHTIEFSVDREAMLRQIVEVEARPLVDHRGVRWESADAALRLYLSKDREIRPTSLDPMKQQLAAAIEDRESSTSEPHASNFVGDVVAFRNNRSTAPERVIKDGFGLGSATLRDFDLLTPRCSLNYGAAGIAYALLRASELCDDAELLWAADAWIERAEHHAPEPESFTATRLEATRRRIGYASLGCAEPGVFFVKSLVRAATGDLPGMRSAVNQYIAAATHKSSHAADVNLGGAGLAIGCDRLARLPLPAQQRGSLSKLRDRLVTKSWESARPSLHSRSRLGFAHGISGVVFAALTGGTCPEADEAVARLRPLAVMIRRGVRWPVRGGSDYFMHGWCNGVAGHLLMWTRQWQCSGSSEDREMLERVAWGVWESRMSLGNVCCGAAGQAAALAVFGAAADEPVWRSRAREFLNSFQPKWPKDDHPQSLFRGDLGLQLIRLECESANPRFPIWGASLG